MHWGTRWRWRSLGAALALAALVVSTAACGAEPANRPLNQRPTPTSQLPPTASTVAPAPLPPDGLVNITDQCARRGHVDLSQHANMRGQYRTCVAVGVTLDLGLDHLFYGIWQPLTADSTAVTVDQNITAAQLTAHIVAARPGVTVLSTRTTVVGDPNGPPSVAWMLTLTVRA
jgi:hypothetical protein